MSIGTWVQVQPVVIGLFPFSSLFLFLSCSYSDPHFLPFPLLFADLIKAKWLKIYCHWLYWLSLVASLLAFITLSTQQQDHDTNLALDDVKMSTEKKLLEMGNWRRGKWFWVLFKGSLMTLSLVYCAFLSSEQLGVFLSRRVSQARGRGKPLGKVPSWLCF